MPNFSDVFTGFQEHLDKEQLVIDNIRSIVSEIDGIARKIVYILQVVHHDVGAESSACGKARELFENVREKYEKLAKVFPLSEYYRYHDLWKYVTQKLCFCAALIVWLEVGILISRETAAGIIGISHKEDEGVFHLDLEDFLMGLLDLITELSRFAVNSVTLGEYHRPIQISRFVNDVNAGFRLLSLKNDALRRRFDGLKYDVKKIEEVVYDLGLRNLIPRPQESD